MPVCRCNVLGCTFRTNTNLLSQVKLFRFPTHSKEPGRRALWLNRTRRLDTAEGRALQEENPWFPNNSSRVCNRHFMSGAPSTDPNHPDYAPCLHLNYGDEDIKPLEVKTEPSEDVSMSDDTLASMNPQEYNPLEDEDAETVTPVVKLKSDSCAVKGCTIRRGLINKDPYLFYMLPVDDMKCALWLSRTGRNFAEEGEPNPLGNKDLRRNFYICSKHFIGGEHVRDPSSPAYLPSLFLPELDESYIDRIYIKQEEEDPVDEQLPKEPRIHGIRKKNTGRCAVAYCKNIRFRGDEKGFYKFPRDTKQRRVWMKAVKTVNPKAWKYKSWHFICSDHFKGGVRTFSPGSIGYTPTIFRPTKATKQRTSKTSQRTAANLDNAQMSASRKPNEWPLRETHQPPKKKYKKPTLPENLQKAYRSIRGLTEPQSITYSTFLENTVSVPELAEVRGLTVDTVVEHLCAAIEAGLKLNLILIGVTESIIKQVDNVIRKPPIQSNLNELGHVYEELSYMSKIHIKLSLASIKRRCGLKIVNGSLVLDELPPLINPKANSKSYVEKANSAFGVQTMTGLQKLRRQGRFTDIKLRSSISDSKKVFYAHRLVLAIASTKMSDALMETPVNGVIELKTSDKGIMALLEALYTGRLVVPDEKMGIELNNIANELGMISLAQGVKAYLVMLETRRATKIYAEVASQPAESGSNKPEAVSILKPRKMDQKVVSGNESDLQLRMEVVKEEEEDQEGYGQMPEGVSIPDDEGHVDTSTLKFPMLQEVVNSYPLLSDEVDPTPSVSFIKDTDVAVKGGMSSAAPAAPAGSESGEIADHSYSALSRKLTGAKVDSLIRQNQMREEEKLLGIQVPEEEISIIEKFSKREARSIETTTINDNKREKFNSYISMYTQTPTYRCIVCSASVWEFKECLEHIKKEHDISEEKVNKYVLIKFQNLDFGSYDCNQCEARYCTTPASKMHLKVEHDIITTSDNLGEYFTINRNVLQYRFMRKVKELDCPMKNCSFIKTKSRSTADFNYHMYFEHGVTLPDHLSTYLCPICKVEFASFSECRSHELEHSGKGVMCSHCGLRFKNKSSLKVHVHSKHSDERTQCPVCGKLLMSKLYLRIHMYLHDDFKPFGCNICPYKSINVGNMKVHFKTKHSDIACNFEDSFTRYKKAKKNSADANAASESDDSSTNATVSTAVDSEKDSILPASQTAMEYEAVSGEMPNEILASEAETPPLESSMDST